MIKPVYHFLLITQLTSGKGDIHSDLRINNYPIEKLLPYIEQLTELRGSLSLASQQTITQAQQSLNLKVQKSSINLQDNNITHLADHSSIKLTDAILSQKDSKATIAAFKQLSLADIKRLLDIGEQREHAFKDYLIEQCNIESSRILFCKPQIDSDEGAMPRIAISV